MATYDLVFHLSIFPFRSSNSALQNRLQLLYVFAHCFYSGPNGTAFLPIFFAVAAPLSFLPILPLYRCGSMAQWKLSRESTRASAGLTNVACSDMLPMKTLVNSQCIMIKMIMCLWFIGFLSVSLRCTDGNCHRNTLSLSLFFF